MQIPKNIEASKELVKRYRFVTLKEINSFWVLDIDGDFIANKLTGFNNAQTCTLCIAISRHHFVPVTHCQECVYVNPGSEGIKAYYCCKDNNIPSYQAIQFAITPTELLEAFRNRADHLEKVIMSHILPKESLDEYIQSSGL